MLAGNGGNTLELLELAGKVCCLGLKRPKGNAERQNTIPHAPWGSM
jgi:hypothetical protein